MADMHQVQLGSAGIKVSELCLGMMSYGDPEWRPWVLPAGEAHDFVDTAAGLGVTFFDTADTYSNGISEVATGKALRAVFSNREDYVLATKVYMPSGTGPNSSGLSRAHILSAVDASLRRLGVDYIDLYQIHRWDDATPIEETMGALNDCVRWGKVRYIGASSMHAWQFQKAQGVAAQRNWAQFVSMQPQYNLIYREDERELLPMCLQEGIGVIPWSPLARGLLTRRPDDVARTQRYVKDARIATYGDHNQEVIAAVVDVARELGATMAQVAIAWLGAQPHVTAPIVGATKIEHLRDLAGALEISLSPDQVRRLEGNYRPREAIT